MADLSKLVPISDTVTVLLKTPDGEYILKDDGTEQSITVYATFSKEYKAALHKQTNKRLTKAQKSKGNVTFSAEDIDNAAVEVLAETTKEWDIQLGGECPKLTTAKAMEVYNAYYFIKEQVAEEQEDFTGFLKV